MTEPKENTQLAKKEEPINVRFMNMVVSQFGSSVGEIALTNFQKRLAQNYFMAIDAALRIAEEKRKKKTFKQEQVPIIWANVNMDELARNIVSYARIGLDPAQKNHIAVIPFKNNTTGKYDIALLEEYRGIELKSKKYGLDVPDHVVVELVCENDHFKSFKKDRNNQYESYEFEILDDFNRGKIKGGFYYHIYNDNPEKNKLVVFTLKDIEKRRPEHASVEFWGGEKDLWEKDEKTGKNKKVGTVQVEGWYERMCWKTIYRAAYNDITIDSQKIDDDYLRLKHMEETLADAQIAQEIAKNANTEIIDITPEELPNDAPVINADGEQPVEGTGQPIQQPENTGTKPVEPAANTSNGLFEQGPGF